MCRRDVVLAWRIRGDRDSPLRASEMGLLCRCGHYDRLDLGGTEFIFRDLAERIELRVGQDVGGGFGIAKRDEHLTWGDRAVGARLQFDRAAAGGDTDLFARGDAEAAQFGGSETGDRLGLELVEHARAPRYRPGVPMFELTAGGQHHRV